MTVIEIINEVQRQLRLPLSPDLTYPHAALLLSFLNDIQRNHMMENAIWDELKSYGSINTVAGVSTGTLVTGVEVDFIRNLQIGNNDPLEPCSDVRFLALKRTSTSQGQPLAYRRKSRLAGMITIELFPIPDAIYQIDYELLQKPPRLTAVTDVPLLDIDAIILGVKLKALSDQGEDVSLEMDAYTSKLSLSMGTQGDSNNGDVDFL